MHTARHIISTVPVECNLSGSFVTDELKNLHVAESGQSMSYHDNPSTDSKPGMSLLFPIKEERDLMDVSDAPTASTLQAIGIPVAKVEDDTHNLAVPASSEGHEQGRNLPAMDNSTPVTVSAVPPRVQVTPMPCGYRSPAWHFFRGPSGCSDLVREREVICMMCGSKVKRGSDTGRLGTTALFIHLERHHGLTRELVCKEAASSLGHSLDMRDALSAGSSSRDNMSTYEHFRSFRHGASPSLIHDEEGRHRPKRWAVTVSAAPSDTYNIPVSPLQLPPLNRRQQVYRQRRRETESQSRKWSSALRQALLERLHGSMVMYCEVCHAPLVSGERNQKVRGDIMEAHFQSQHAARFRRLERDAERDLLLQRHGPLFASSASVGLGPSSASSGTH